MMRARIAILFTVASLCTSAGCSDSHTMGVNDSQTHWLESCSSSAECGELECICGTCTQRCETSKECGEASDGKADACRDTLDVSACSLDASSTAICLTAAPLSLADASVPGDGKCADDEDPTSAPEDCAVAGDGLCTAGETPEANPNDCAIAGDGLCTADETPEANPNDCAVAGDGLCTGDETPEATPSDCGVAGDGLCTARENPRNTPMDCAVAGDGLCTAHETPANAPEDCALAGDGLCTVGENAFHEPGVCPSPFRLDRGDQQYLYGISEDGRYVFVQLRQSNYYQDYRYDLQTGDRVALGQNGTGLAVADGSEWCFGSGDDSLVDDDTNGRPDIFCQDIESGTYERVNLSNDGYEADGSGYSGNPMASADGRFVAFTSTAPNLVDSAPDSGLYLRDRALETTELVLEIPEYDQPFTAFGFDDSKLYLNDSAAPGTWIGWREGLIAYDLTNQTTSPVAEDADYALYGFTDRSGDLRVFVSGEALLPEDTNGAMDVYLEHVPTGQLHRVSVTPGGRQKPRRSYKALISPDGRFVVMASDADLTTEDNQARLGIYVAYVGDVFAGE